MTQFPTDNSYDTLYIQTFWQARKESPDQIAGRIRATATALRKINTAFGDLIPYLDKKTTSDSGQPLSVLSVTQSELADLIDERCRFDVQPASPEPVTDFGYSILLGNYLSHDDPLSFTLCINAGRSATDMYNSVTIQNEVWTDNALWCDETIPCEIFEILVDCWEAELGAIYGYKYCPPPPGCGHTSSKDRTWIYWTRPNVALHNLYKSMQPPMETYNWLDGKLSIWP